MIRSFWAKAIGQPPGFTLEARIFNAVCLVSAICVFLTIFLNSLLGIPQLVILMAAILATNVLCYYYSRFKMKLENSIVAYMIAINLLLVVNFKYNSGIDGPSVIIFILSFFLTISIVPQKQYWFWIILNLLILTALLTIQYEYPGIIINTYIDSKSRFIDLGCTYIFLVFFIFLVTTAVRKSYYTERKLVEQKAAELEQANDTKNKLFSILAHDLRSPLASIQNYLEILSEVKLDEDERLSINNALLNSTQNTQQLLSNLLFWSKSQMEGVTVNLVKVKLKKILHATLQIQHAAAAEKGIRLTDQLKNSTTIIADADMFELIIRNLINNAIKFTEPGGEIIISADVSGGNCCIMIRDNGTGIPFEQQKDIFSLKASSTFGTKK